MMKRDIREPRIKEIIMLPQITGNISLDMIIKDLCHAELNRIECAKIEMAMGVEHEFNPIRKHRLITGCR